MKNSIVLSSAFLLILIVSCNNNSTKKDIISTGPVKKESKNIGLPTFPVSSITKDFITYWTYNSRHVKLYNDFVAFNEADKAITKMEFLEKLSSGDYIPILLNSKDSILNYKLDKITSKMSKDIGPAVREFAKTQFIFYKMEGKPLPNFKFKDINGTEYTPASTKGKMVLLKCWFIKCHNCVAEMPKLNELVNNYKDKNDVLFISLAIDDKKPLEDFIKKTKFEYAVVPNQEPYMVDKLKISGYPTHILVDKNGLIVHMTNDVDDLNDILSKYKG